MKLREALLLAGFFGALSATSVYGQPSTSDDGLANRHFEMIYSGSINSVPPDSHVRVWIPVAQSSAEQNIIQMTSQLPGVAVETKESVHGNKMLYFEFNANETVELPFQVTYQVRRKEVNALGKRKANEITEKEKRQYIQANRLVPVDGVPLELLNGLQLSGDELEMAHQLYDQVDFHMTYDKTKPGYGHGDVIWACNSQTGNCTDFHSLFISLMRSRHIPAHFEIGFPLPSERGEGKIGGYHCWAKFSIDRRGWIPVDISEADKHPEMKDYFFGNLTENRIAFTRGRDIDLNPKQAGQPLNYFIYPYVEVNGEIWPQENIETDFRFKDLQED